MELLISAVITVITRLVKWLTKKLGGEMAGAITLIVAFLLSVAGVLVWKGWTEGFDTKNWDTVITLFGISMAWYEVVLKRILSPILGKLKKTA